MSYDQPGFFRPGKPYVPASLSEINDMLGAMILTAPTFTDKSGVFPKRNIDSIFQQFTDGLALVRKKLGEDRYARLSDLAARAKALFAADQDDTNGKARDGWTLLFEIEDVLRDARRRRVKERLPDDEGKVTGD